MSLLSIPMVGDVSLDHVLYCSVLLASAMIGGHLLLLPRRKSLPVFRAQKIAGDTCLLYWLLWTASLSILAYIVFAFGKR